MIDGLILSIDVKVEEMVRGSEVLTGLFRRLETLGRWIDSLC